jgi:hypothetical protein
MHPKYGLYNNQVNYSCQNMILQLRMKFWNVNVKNFENKEKLKRGIQAHPYGPSLIFPKQLVYLKGITFNNLWIINIKVI